MCLAYDGTYDFSRQSCKPTALQLTIWTTHSVTDSRSSVVRTVCIIGRPIAVYSYSVGLETADSEKARTKLNDKYERKTCLGSFLMLADPCTCRLQVQVLYGAHTLHVATDHPQRRPRSFFTPLTHFLWFLSDSDKENKTKTIALPVHIISFLFFSCLTTITTT